MTERLGMIWRIRHVLAIICLRSHESPALARLLLSGTSIHGGGCESQPLEIPIDGSSTPRSPLLSVVGRRWFVRGRWKAQKWMDLGLSID